MSRLIPCYDVLKGTVNQCPLSAFVVVVIIEISYGPFTSRSIRNTCERKKKKMDETIGYHTDSIGDVGYSIAGTLAKNSD